MRDRNHFPPGEWQMLHPEAGQKEPWKGSFSEIAAKELAFRQQNPAIVQKNNLSLNPADIENDVDAYNTQRMIAGGYFNFVEFEGDYAPSPEKKTRFNPLAGAVAGAKAIAAGVGVWLEMFGPEGKTVSQDVAERRAATCVRCQLNDTKTSIKNLFLDKAAQEIQQVYGILNNLDLHTSQDEKLGVCRACLCPLKSKVWADISHIANHLTDEMKEKLWSECWIRAELS
jgi:hypothetical protein